MGNSYIRVNTAIKPQENIVSEVIRLSSDIDRTADAYFVLDNINFFPHMTLYSPEYPDRNLDMLYREVDEIKGNFGSFRVKFNSFRSHLGYIDLSLEKTEKWVKLHEKIVNALNPLRENHLREKYRDPKQLAIYLPIQQAYIKKFGASEVFDSFVPHLTLARLKDEREAKEIVKKLKFSIEEFTIDTLALYTMGDHGTCDRILKEFPL